MRLFTGIAIDPEVLANLKSVLDELKATASLNWSKVENLHITTKFIGEWPPARLPELKKALTTVEGTGPIEIALRGFGFFPSPQRARVFYAGVEAGPKLGILAERVETACETVGVKREDREYSPHLTLAKIRNAKVTGLRERIADMVDRDMGAFTANEFHLYLSQPSAGGSVYTQLESFPLA